MHLIEAEQVINLGFYFCLQKTKVCLKCNETHITEAICETNAHFLSKA